MKKYKVKLTKLARRDIDEIFSQIEEIAYEQSAFRTVTKIYKKIFSLNYLPERTKWPYIPGNMRVVHAGKYSIIYEAFNENLTVEVLRVVFSRRNMAKLKVK